MSIYNFFIIFQHQKKYFTEVLFFKRFFLNLTNLNSEMVFVHFINVILMQFSFINLKGPYQIIDKI